VLTGNDSTCLVFSNDNRLKFYVRGSWIVRRHGEWVSQKSGHCVDTSCYTGSRFTSKYISFRHSPKSLSTVSCGGIRPGQFETPCSKRGHWISGDSTVACQCRASIPNFNRITQVPHGNVVIRNVGCDERIRSCVEAAGPRDESTLKKAVAWYRRFADQIEAAIVQPGYVVVPVEPTPEMFAAALAVAEQQILGGYWNTDCGSYADRSAKSNRIYWQAMIAAAPKASHDR